jgi:hypothetical protein
VEHVESNPTGVVSARTHVRRSSTEEGVMSKIPPAMWEDPEAFEPDEVREVMVESDPEAEAKTPKRHTDETDEDDEDLED